MTLTDFESKEILNVEVFDKAAWPDGQILIIITETRHYSLEYEKETPPNKTHQNKQPGFVNVNHQENLHPHRRTQ